MASLGSIDPANALKSIQLDLVACGFLLCDLAAVTSLPEEVWLEPYVINSGANKADEADSAVLDLIPQGFESGSLLLVGHAGKKLWESYRLHEEGEAIINPDPIDSYSAEVTQQVIEKHLPEVQKQQLFPAADCPVNLMALGRAFAWHAPSPLGMGIHEEYGLWSAYRAAWWLDIELTDNAKLSSPSKKLDNSSKAAKTPNNLSTICVECETLDCVSACPADAIDISKTPDLGRCADYRLAEASQCESTCLSRMACPYAAEHRYTEPQMRYHYELARSAIAHYRNKSQ